MFRRQTAAMGGVLVSVSGVRVSPDLSIFPSDKAQDILANINKSAKSIRYELAKTLRYQLRKTPELSFFIDDSLDYIEHIDNILKQDTALHRNEGGEEEE